MTLKQKTIEALNGLTSSTLTTNDMSLEVVAGPHTGQTLHLEEELVRIGRADWCDLVLSQDQWVSNHHCECWLDEKGLRVRDLKSRNGILIEGIPVFDAYLPVGSKLQVGQSFILLQSHQQRREISIHFRDASGTLVGKSRQMRKIFSMLARLGKHKIPTLLYGETGTGKTSIANAIHQQSPNPHAPFVVVNCGALPAGLIEAALFGYEKGAFTSADKAHAGFFEQANGGTLFLDEIAELPLDLQPKLLDALERRIIRRLGSDKERKLDFRLIAATNRNLHREVKEGRFREDLYFRLSVMELEVPPLRERKEDIPLLVEAMLKDLREVQPIFVTSRAIQSLEEYLWPGNIRELRNILERSIIFLDGDTLDLDDLVLPRQPASPSTPTPLSRRQHDDEPNKPINTTPPPVHELLPLFPLQDHDPPISLKDALVEVERCLLQQALEESDYSAPEAAKLLNISESWLYNRIRRYDLNNRRRG